MQLIVNTVDISTGAIKMILHKDLLMKKVCAQWVPQMLDWEMNDSRCQISSENLKLMQ